MPSTASAPPHGTRACRPPNWSGWWKTKTLRPARTLELGCGTGADAIYLAARGFEMTAVDSSPIAIERARARAEREDALLRLVLADAFEFGQTAGQFELVFDVGLYHYIRHTDLDRFVDLLWRRDAAGLLLLHRGRPQARASRPRAARRRSARSRSNASSGACSRSSQLRMCRLASPHLKGGYPAWSCLMHRPVAAKPAV